MLAQGAPQVQVSVPALTHGSVKVIVLSYNGTADTLACLDSLMRDSQELLDILVIDNASTDGAPAAIRACFPNIDMLELSENLGWAGGNNVGIERALGDGTEFVCLLNNDTVVPESAMSRMAATARRLEPCLLQPAIDFADPAEGAQLDPARLKTGDRAHSLPKDPTVYELSYAYGACLMFSTETVRRIGCLDERFFLQMEETDFFLRAKSAGIRSLCDTSVRIVHAESRAFGGRTTPIKTYYIARNTWLLAEKHHRTPAGILRALRSTYWLAASSARDGGTAPLATVLRHLFSRDRYARALRAGLFDYLVRRFGRINGKMERALTS